jgi:hypothetical protein
VRRAPLVALAPVFVALISIVAVSCGTPWAKPATVSVAPGADDSKTLTDALGKVKDGGTITLAAGTYRLSEPVQIVKSVNIAGDGKTIIQCASGDYVAAFGSGSTCTVDGIAFVRTPAPASPTPSTTAAPASISRTAGSPAAPPATTRAAWDSASVRAPAARCLSAR